jgi:hypothetical protein
MNVVRSQDGETWSVVDDDGNILLSDFMSYADALEGMKTYTPDPSDGNDGNDDEGSQDTSSYDWEGQFNLNINELLDKYGVDADMRKYFEGMEYNEQSEKFLTSLFNLEQEKTDLAKGSINRQKTSLMSGLDMNLEGILGQGETESYKLNQASTQRQSQIGGARGGAFADRFQTQNTSQSVYGQQNQMMGQAEDKLGSLNDAMTNLDFEAQQSAISFEQDLYGERQQWMDDFFDRLMQVEQMEES